MVQSKQDLLRMYNKMRWAVASQIPPQYDSANWAVGVTQAGTAVSIPVRENNKEDTKQDLLRMYHKVHWAEASLEKSGR